MKKITLASGSSRRRELLASLGVEFVVEPSNYEEKLQGSTRGVDSHKELTKNPHTLVKKLALEKAKDVGKRHQDSLIIAADTIVFVNEQFLGKPKDEKDAKRMLKILSGTTHLVVTGLAIIDTESRKEVLESVETKVTVRVLTNEDIDAYIATGEPMDKAGAYGIQGKGSVLIEKIEGDFSNVVGLPLAILKEKLQMFGIEV